MASRRKTVFIVVDAQFFDNVFEKQRKQLQDKLGLDNLGQAKFTKMITNLKIRKLKEPISKPIKRRGRKKINEFIF